MEAEGSSEMSVNINHTTRRHIAQDNILQLPPQKLQWSNKYSYSTNEQSNEFNVESKAPIHFHGLSSLNRVITKLAL